MMWSIAVVSLAMTLGMAFAGSAEQEASQVEVVMTTSDLTQRMFVQPSVPIGPMAPGTSLDILIDPSKSYQSILGIGSSLEHSTCYNISRLPAREQEAVVERIVHPQKGIGMNLMRICIGTPDFTASPWYTYDDMPPGKTDPEMAKFSIEKDREYVLPILKMALAKNPDLLFVASTWCPPAWMTTKDQIGGGAMKSEHLAAYARYLARFVKAYEAEGLPIWAITPQNEPHCKNPRYPTCYWTGEQERDLIRDHLGPEFARQGITTQIWSWDHNFNEIDYPMTVLKDAQAAQYVAGVAFHHYGGKPEAMTEIHEAFPTKDVFFTEGSTFGVGGAAKIIRYMRNWTRSYNAWVTLIDDRKKPNPGPHMCALTAVVLGAEDLKVSFRFEYFMYGQFCKFIQRGAVRIDSSQPDEDLPNCAFRNPSGETVLVVVNMRRSPRAFRVGCQGQAWTGRLPGHAMATYRWISP